MKWIDYIKSRIEKNKNFLAIISGPTGSGKSWAGLSLGELIDPEFCAERVVFKGKDLMELINSGKLKKGSVIVWDETQIDLSNRNWQSVTNKMLNYLLSTFRHKNFILFFTSPYSDFIDSATLKLFHANFETRGINKAKKTVTLSPKLLQYNQSIKKWYRKYLKVKTGNGLIKVKSLVLDRPSKNLIDEYENKKNKFTKNLNFDISEKLGSLNSFGESKGSLTNKQQAILDCWKQGIFLQKDIAKKTGLTRNNLSSVEGAMYKKGYKKEVYVEEFKENQSKGEKVILISEDNKNLVN